VASPSSSNSRRRSASSAAHASLTEWQGTAPSGHEVHVRRQSQVWQVVYGGFSRSSDASLASALAEATGSPASSLWIRSLVQQFDAGGPPPSDAEAAAGAEAPAVDGSS
jgi:hypothetical protein